MKSLILYDNTGAVLSVMTGNVSENCSVLIADIPDGYNVTAVNVETGEVVTERKPQTEKERLANIEAVVTERMASHAGTAEDPIPWVYGMSCKAGQHFLYNGQVWKVAEGGDMNPCVWPPSAAMWHWILIS